MLKTIALVAGVAAAAAGSPALAMSDLSCSFKDEASGSSFDLSDLTHEAHSPYEADDLDGRNFTYYWNICGYTNPPLSDGSCVGSSPAWQTWQEEGHCYRLGKTWEDPADAQWKLLDKTDPTGGVSLTYKNGEACEGGKRSFTINLLCKDEEDVPDRTVVEQDCHYTVEFKTPLACPLECPLGAENRKLCSAHGRCEFDPHAGRPRCLCNEGYYTADCSSQGHTRSRSSCDGTCGAMIFLMIVLLTFIVLVAMAWYNTVRKHGGYIGGGTALHAGLVDRESQDDAAYVTEDRSPNAGGARNYGHAEGDHEMELNLDE